MTTGRINQVTVLHARQKSRTRQRVHGLSPFPRPELVTDRSSRTLPPHEPQTPHPLGQPSHSCADRVPSPPDLTNLRDAPPVLWTEVGPFSEDYRQAATPQRGLPERSVSSIGWLQTELANRQ